MNKAPFVISALLALAGILAGCVTTSQKWAQADPAVRSEFFLRQHYSVLARSNVPFPLGNLGWHESRDAWEKIPELQTVHRAFMDASAAIDRVLENDSEYAALLQWYKSQHPSNARKEEWDQKKSPIFARLAETNEAYRLAREVRDRALFVRNARTLDYLIQQAKKDNRVLPTEWIPSEARKTYAANFE